MAVVGDRIRNRYTLREQLGTGGMGAVWLASDDALDRDVALKCPQLGDKQSVKRLHTEARNAARLRHRNIVAVFDVFDEDSTCWLVMEYIDGVSLAHAARESGTLDLQSVATIGGQIAEALAHAHTLGITHGDVTPENIILAVDGTAKLADFGISYDMWGDVTRTDNATIRGKLPYLAPEVARGLPAGMASDVFSLGASLFTAVEGHSPLGEVDHPAAWVTRSADGTIETPRKAGPLTTVLTCMTSVSPKSRPSAAEVSEMCKQISSPTAAVPRSDKRRSALSTAARRRGRFVMFVAAAVVVGTVAAGGYAFFHRMHPRSVDQTMVVGDPHTADPCALLTAATLTRFGDTILVADAGNFDRCDLSVRADGGEVGDVKLALLTAAPDLVTSVRTTRIGNVTVLSEQANGARCERTLVLTDGHRINITGRQDIPTGPDPCALADAVTSYSVDVLNRGPIPRRPVPLPAESLASADTCELLDGPALRSVPGVDALHPVAGFGQWSCRWNSTIDGAARLMYDRHPPLTATDGQPITLRDRQAFVAPASDSPSDCTIRTEYRPYTNITGQPRVELIVVQVYGTQPMAERCATAKTLSIAALDALATKLPH